MDILNNLYDFIGPDDQDLQWWQMGVRAFLVFIFMVLAIRLSNKRIFGKQTAFDIVLGIILGSIFSRAITGNSPFFPTLFAGLVLVLLHRLLGFLAVQTAFGNAIKGTKQKVVENGKLNHRQMKYASLSHEDVLEQLRAKEGLEDISKVKVAYLERNGEMSFIVDEK